MIYFQIPSGQGIDVSEALEYPDYAILALVA